jgi:hypothetical protein
MNLEAVRRLIANARAAGRRVLLETEGLELLAAIGVERPRPGAVSALSSLRKDDEPGELREALGRGH